jgi:hypothetical protein
MRCPAGPGGRVNEICRRVKIAAPNTQGDLDARPVHQGRPGKRQRSGQKLRTESVPQGIALWRGSVRPSPTRRCQRRGAAA